MLLIPTREPNSIALLSLGVFALLGAFEMKRLHGRAIMDSKEGFISRAILAAPYVTLLGRNLLLYQNSGYVQCGYRFSLDFMIYFMVLLAIGNRPLTKRFRALVVVAFAINLFLAITFDRYPEFSYDDSFFPHGNN